MEPQRIAKLIARAGVCSRRDAERLIAEGRVKLDGKVLDTPAIVVDDPRRIQVDNKPLAAPEKTRLWRYHKPSGLVTTARDPEGRATVFERLPKDLPRVISVGRLDLTSQGLLLLTNDGALARHLELPSTGWVRRYRVRVHGMVDLPKLAMLSRGVTIEGIRYGAVEATLEREKGLHSWLVMGLTEGRNREVRRLCEWMGLQVTRLIRVSYGPFQLGLLPRGEVEEVPARVLRDQLGVGAKEGAKDGNKDGGEEKPRPDRNKTGQKRPEHQRAAPQESPVRIVAGRNRGRALLAPEGIDIRPTADRARQAVFDVLAHNPEMPERLLSDAIVLDAFAGTGAMGLEALSRGAQRCTFLDRDQRAIACLRANAQALHELSRASFLRADATQPPVAPQPATLAFLDPPYGKNLCTPALAALAESGWFAPGAIVVVEHDSGEAIEDLPGFQDIESRRYGRAQFLFLRYGEAAS